MDLPSRVEWPDLNPLARSTGRRKDFGYFVSCSPLHPIVVVQPSSRPLAPCRSFIVVVELSLEWGSTAQNTATQSPLFSQHTPIQQSFERNTHTHIHCELPILGTQREKPTSAAPPTTIIILFGIETKSDRERERERSSLRGIPRRTCRV